ncbi:MAG: DUF1501 domain-containing protein, partial [Akkermansiaceae bacterium]
MNADQNEGWYDENRPDLTRRRFLQALGATSAATLMGSAPLRGEKVEQPKATADACILIWMAGGMAAPETFDPKRYFPFEVGTPVEKIISTFPAIDTAVDNIKICQGLERIAAVMDRGTIIRSAYQADL